MLPCPRCSAQLVRSRGTAGLFYVCPDCDGRMVAMPVLRRSKAREQVNRIWQDARQGRGRASRPCCFCRKPMREVHATDAAPPRRVS